MKRNKKNVSKLCLVGLLVASSFSACSTKKENEIQDTNITQEEMATIPPEEINDDVIKYEADLTGDGENEIIIVDVSKIKKDGQEMAIISVTDSTGKELWSEEAGLPHMAWKSYYLCCIDGEYSIVRYNPYDAQGIGTYSYERFTLSEKGEQIIEVKEVEFQTYALEENVLDFPIEEMLSFVDNVNVSLSNSFLLLNTYQGELKYSTEENKITYIEKYQYIIPDDIQREELSLKEKIEKTRQRILEESK